MTNPGETTSSTTLRVKVIGIGGAGATAIEHMARTDLAELPLCAIHTHARVLQAKNLPHKLLVGMERTHGLGTGGDPEVGRAMGENERGRISEICSSTDLVFLVAGLGGGTGTGMAPVVAAAAKQTGALVLAVVALPFDFEGPRRLRQAHLGLQTLRAAADAVICLPNQKISKLLDGNTTILDAFWFTNDLLAQGVRGIWRMLTRPGQINVDFAYLCSVLRGRHVESSLATATASGEHRVRDVINNLLENPLLDGGQALADADDVLVSVTAGPDLTIAEIQKLMEQLTRRMEKANLTLGTALDEEMNGALNVTLIAARNSKLPALAADEGESPSRLAIAKTPDGLDTSFFEQSPAPRPAPRFKAPAPPTTPELTQGLLEKSPRGRKPGSKWKQEMLALEVISRGRFEKSEPTIHRGADLDVPTYIRRGVPMN